jgi:hypothetical protein
MRLAASVCCFVIVLSAGIANACSCAPPPPPKKALEQASAVFAGKVTAVERDGSENVVTISVSRTWKGTEGQTVQVRTLASGSLCGYGFQKGKSYLVYCNKAPKKNGKSGALTTHLCTRTKLLANANDDLKALGDGRNP